jgi:DNA-binding winged helix-turn-helix (wHTH) protein
MNFIAKIAIIPSDDPALVAAASAIAAGPGYHICTEPGDADAILRTGTARSDHDWPAVPVFLLEKNARLKVQALLRQTEQMVDDPALFIDVLNIGRAAFFPAERRIKTAAAEEIELTDKEANILVLLLQRRGRPIQRQELLERVWKYQPGTQTHTVETHIYRLRQKMEGHRCLDGCLQTDAGGGYYLSLPPVEPLPDSPKG